MKRVPCRWLGCTEPRIVPVYLLGRTQGGKEIRVRCRFRYCRKHVDAILRDGETPPRRETP